MNFAFRNPAFRTHVFPRVVVAATIFGGCVTGVRAAAPASEGVRRPVLVELFTSEGCSSCPPADELLRRLDKEQPVPGAEVIVLSEHVDYWDQGGWRDRFSSALLTQRQTEYTQRLGGESPYTPQMIVDGKEQFVGNDVQRALRSIGHAAETAKLPIVLSQPMVEGRAVTAEASLGAGDPIPHAGSLDVFAALVDPMAVTEVRKGENGGRHLEHAGVVRVLKRVGTMAQMEHGALRFELKAPADAETGSMRVVVFTVRGGQGAVLGAAARAVTEGKAVAELRPGAQ